LFQARETEAGSSLVQPGSLNEDDDGSVGEGFDDLAVKSELWEIGEEYSNDGEDVSCIIRSSFALM
jgi:hypothetical protein